MEHGRRLLLPVLAAVFVGLLVGVLATAGKAVFILLLFGGMVSVVLMAKPVPLLFLAVLYTLAIGGGVKYLVPNLGALAWVGYLLAAALYVPAILAIVTSKDSHRYTARLEDLLFIWACGGFLLVAVATIAMNAVGGPQLLGAIKTYVLYAGVWFALSALALSPASVRNLIKAFIVIGLVQWIPTILQYIYAANFRHDAGKATASDAVVGTFGGNPESGGLSAVLTLYLVLVICAMIQSYRVKQLTTKRLAVSLVALSVPLLLTEVKALFIYLPIAILLLFRDRIKEKPAQFVLSIPIFATIITGALFAYFSLHWSGEGDSLGDVLEKKFSYSFEVKDGEQAVDLQKLSRREVWQFWWKENRGGPVGKLLLGHGLGASKVGGRIPGVIGEKYRGLNVDGNGIAVLLWDVGVIGTMFFLLMLISSAVIAFRLSKSSRLEDWQRTTANVLAIGFVLFIVSLPYRNDIPYAAPMMLMLVASLGLVSWLKKQDAKKAAQTLLPAVSE